MAELKPMLSEVPCSSSLPGGPTYQVEARGVRGQPRKLFHPFDRVEFRARTISYDVVEG